MRRHGSPPAGPPPRPGPMMRPQGVHPAPHHLPPRTQRVALAACGLFMAVLLLLGGPPRAFAHPASTAPHPTPVATAQPTPSAPQPAPVAADQEGTVEIPSLGV